MVVNSIQSAIQVAMQNGDKEPFIIGGGQIYKMALEENIVDKIYLTRIHQSYDGDTFFPKFGPEWKEISRVSYKADEKHAHDYSFLTFEKNS